MIGSRGSKQLAATIAAPCSTLVALLMQLREALRTLSSQQYARTPLAPFAGSVGPQVRHTLDHLLTLVEGIRSGALDYDRRERGTRVETERECALEQIDTLIAEIGRLSGVDPLRPLRVALNDATPEAATQWVDSCAAREVAFIESHTVHHMALLAAMLRTLGVEPPAEFGYARSTLRFSRQSVCAPSPLFP